jgi:hypothetical protein
MLQAQTIAAYPLPPQRCANNHESTVYSWARYTHANVTLTSTHSHHVNKRCILTCPAAISSQDFRAAALISSRKGLFYIDAVRQSMKTVGKGRARAN